jgi:biopolymer transport protein ExbD
MIQSSKPGPRLIGTDMTPLIDVVFLLLVFFLYALMHMVEAKGVALSLPQAANVETVMSSPLSIDLTAGGKIMIDGIACEKEDVVSSVHAALNHESSRKILIRADRDSRTGLTVSVMSLLKNAGYDAVTLAVEEAP